MLERNGEYFLQLQEEEVRVNRVTRSKKVLIFGNLLGSLLEEDCNLKKMQEEKIRVNSDLAKNMLVSGNCRVNF